jgi:Mg2+-importing ATPase
VESLITQLAIVLVVRTHMAFWKSRPSPMLTILTLGIALLAVAFPYLPFAAWFGFVALPLQIVAGLLAISILYVIVSEATKRWFFARGREAHLRRTAKRRGLPSH